MKGRQIFFFLLWPHSSALVSRSSRCVPWNYFTNTLVKSAENCQYLHRLFYYFYIPFVFWIVPSQLANSKHQITFLINMGGGACLQRWEATWQKLLCFFPTSNFNHQACKRDPLFAETSHQFPEKFFHMYVCSHVWWHMCMQAVSTSAALHFIYGGPRCLTDSLCVYTACPGE